MSDRQLTKSGNTALDQQIGGLVAGRPYLISGSPGSGKSVSCLEFLNVALDHEQQAVLLTHDDPTDVMATAEFLGIGLEPMLRDGRLVLLRFQLDFVRRFGRAASADDALAELKRLIGPAVPSRIAIDSLVPFLDGGGSGSAAMFALTGFLHDLGATALLTYPGDLAGLYDRRLEPLMQRAGGFFHLSSLAQGRRRGQLEIRKLRYEVPSVSPIRFRIEPGAGFIQDGEPNEPEAVLEEIRRRVLVVNVDAPFPAESLSLLERSFHLTVRAGISAAFSDLVRTGIGAVLLNLRRDVIQDGLQLIRELRRSDIRTPIVVVTPYQLRSSDRTRALRAGADDFLSLGIAGDEFVARIRALTRRGRSTAMVASETDGAVAQPMASDGSYEPLTADGFSTTFRAYLGRERAPFFTLIELIPTDGDPAPVAKVALETCRVADGDLVGLLEDRVVILADGARPQDARRLVERLQQAWQTLGRGPLDAEVIGYPAQEERVLERFAPRAA